MSLTRRLPGTTMGAVGLVITLALTIVGGVIATRDYRRDVGMERNLIEAEAGRSADLIQRFLQGQVRALQAAAPWFREASADQAAFRLGVMDADALGFSGGLALVDRDGEVVATSPDLADADASTRDTGVVRLLGEGGGVQIGAARTSASGTAPVLPIAVSLGADADLDILVGWIRLDVTTTPLTPFTLQDQKGFLLDREGQIIATNAPVRRLVRPAGADDWARMARLLQGGANSRQDVDGLSGPHRLIAVTTVPLCACTMLVERPVRTTVGVRQADLVTAIVALALIAGLGGALVLRLARRMNLDHEREQLSRRRAIMLQELNARLPRAPTGSDVGDILVDTAVTALGAARASVLVIPRDHPHEPVVPAGGRAEAIRVAGRTLTPLEQEALHADDLVVVGHSQRAGQVDAAAIALRVGRRTMGLLELRWSSSTVLPDIDGDFLRAIARQGALALERAERQVNDRVQRERAESLQRALAEVARASTREEVLDVVRSRCVPALDGVLGGVVQLPSGWADDADDSPGEVDAGSDLIDRRLWPIVQRAVDSGEGGLYTLPELRLSDPDAAGALVRAGAGSVGAWPVVGARHVHGSLVVLLPDDDDPRDETPTRLSALATQLAQALDRAAAYDVEHEIALTLQRSLMDVKTPEVPGIRIQTFYRAASEAMDVGGDWFDVVLAEEDDLRVVIGDLVGHGLAAAAAMGRMRGAAHAMAGHLLPAELLERLDETASSDDGCFMSSAAAVQVCVGDEHLRYSLAGHPPPLLIRADGSARLLGEATGPPLGIPGPHRPSDEIDLEDGSAILLYTDGLVERRDEPLDRGLERLQEVASALGDHRAEGWLDRLVDDVCGPINADDIAAVLVVIDPRADRED